MLPPAASAMQAKGAISIAVQYCRPCAVVHMFTDHSQPCGGSLVLQFVLAWLAEPGVRCDWYCIQHTYRETRTARISTAARAEHTTTAAMAPARHDGSQEPAVPTYSVHCELSYGTPRSSGTWIG